MSHDGHSQERPYGARPVATPGQSYESRYAITNSESNLAPVPSYPPSYHTGYSSPSHLPTPNPYDGFSHQQPQPQPHMGRSPFDTVFDDNMYPHSSQQKLVPTPDNMSQTGLYQPDGLGYGSYRQPSPDGQPYRTDDVPLQDRSGAVSRFSDGEDHIYDDPNAGKRRRRKKKPSKVGVGELGMLGANRKRIPWVVYILSVAQIAVFIAEIVRNGILTGSPIEIHPQFNPMIGPSPQVMINMGARYVPCMHNVEGIQDSDIPVLFLCPNSTKEDQFCPLSELCGFGGNVPNPTFDGKVDEEKAPNQWYRFIIPIFLHAGIVHIGFNLLLQLTLAKELEMAIGPIRFLLVYFSAGIFGFVMGGNFAAPGIASTGASGALFGILALTLLDLFYSWKERKSPLKDLMFIMIDMIISFVLGLLPGLDNFSHIGGFLMGLALGICVLHSPNSLRRRLGEDPAYSSVPYGTETSTQPFYKNPMGFFQGRKPLWWAWWLVRAAALIGIIVVFIVLLHSFYTVANTCRWCKYLSCLPVNGWCDLGTIKPTTSN